MKVVVVGTGYVGLVTGSCFSEVGIDVTCIDIHEEKIENLKKGILPIYEPGLEEIVLRNFSRNRLKFSSSLKDSIVDADVVFIAVGTPPDEDGSADLKYVLGVAREIGASMQNYLVVVTKSTVPVGTGMLVKNAVSEELFKRQVEFSFDVASNPEFLKEGAAVEDFLKPDRIVVGVESSEAEVLMQKLYKPFVLNGHPVFFMDIPSAEMTKYAANAMLATKISFMNDMANLCEIMGADVNMVRRGIGSDSRIGNKFIYPGVGYGGSCFPKDVKALIKTAKDHGYTMRILDAVEGVNETQKSVLSNKVIKHFGNDLTGIRFAMWGLAFKPKTDDMREAPSLVIIEQLIARGATIIAYDPVAAHETQRIIGNTIEYANDTYESLLNVDALLLVTEWPEFRTPNIEIMVKLMKQRVVFDGRNIFDSKEFKRAGFAYYGIGLK